MADYIPSNGHLSLIQIGLDVKHNFVDAANKVATRSHTSSCSALYTPVLDFRSAACIQESTERFFFFWSIIYSRSLEQSPGVCMPPTTFDSRIPVRRQTYGYLPGRRALTRSMSIPPSRQQILHRFLAKIGSAASKYCIHI